MMLELRVGGVHCANCVRNVTSALQQLPMVRHVNVEIVDQAAHIARVRVVGEASREVLVDTLRAAGYPPGLE